MTALEKIIGQILDDARQEADTVLGSARQEADGILEQAGAQAGENTQAALQEAEQEAARITQRAESAAQLARRNALLTFKQELIHKALDDARASLESAPDEAYFDTLVALYGRFAAEGAGEMHMNERDLARLPQDFEARLKAAAPHSDTTLSKEPIDLSSGFVLTYGGIDVNCSFRAIFEDRESELRDLAGRMLFPAAG